MKNLLTLLAALIVTHSLNASEIRIVNNAHVDISPVRAWFERPAKERKTVPRPMPHWKQIEVSEVLGGAPWPICKIKTESSTKTVYLKNLPASALQFQSQLASLQSQIESLSGQISADQKLLNNADNTYAEYGSEFDQNRNRVRARIQNNSITRSDLQGKLYALKSQHKEMAYDFAMFTGQVYIGKEVWDCGQRQ